MTTQHAQKPTSGERPGNGYLRPTSFYLLLVIPFVLLLSLHSFLDLAEPGKFALGMTCLFIFLAVALQRALVDMLEILRNHLRESRLSYEETLGDHQFVQRLAARGHDETTPS